MASINKVILIGNLGRDPEVRYTANGAAVCSLRLATTRNWKDRNSGERMEETEWHSVVLYDRLAEIAGEYLKKGRSCYIEGRLKTRKWQDKDGHDRYTTEAKAAIKAALTFPDCPAPAQVLAAGVSGALASYRWLGVLKRLTRPLRAMPLDPERGGAGHEQHHSHQFLAIGFARSAARLGLLHVAHCTATKIALASAFWLQ